ncbi:glycerophosphodiester phosphodiesterase [Bdellovibrio sp. HCB337]|uniref:glycerophosphodiester phosphodiesterase n=1 Tax=Bdellovibrio sp. HCB337 TaxID=3394358 RepID=UPI0039A41C2F
MKVLLFSVILLAATVSSAAQSVGHRGAPHFAPENTVSSFIKAIELKVDFLEIDVQQTKDGVLVIMHDSTVNRTTDGDGDVKDLTFKQIRSLDAGSSYSQDFAGEKVPTFEEVLELSQLDPHFKFIIELKEGSDVVSGIEENVVREIRKHGLENRVLLKSFSYPVLQRLRKQLPEAEQIYVYVTAFPSLNLMIDTSLRLQNPLNFDVEYLQPLSKVTHPGFIKKAHKANKKVIVWGVETKAQMQRWIDAGADAIETDRLDIFNQL